MKKLSGKYSAFVSYASDNREKAEDICASLESRGFVCWIAPRDVRAGREYADEIIGGIERSACVVLVLSEAANTSVFVRREVERAASKNKPIFPVRVEEVTPSSGMEFFISGTHWLDAWTGDWDDHMARLARDLAHLPAGRPLAEVSSGRLPLSERRGVRMAYIAAGLVLVAAVSGVAVWSVFRATQTSQESSNASEEQPNPPLQASVRQDGGRGPAPAPDDALRTRADQVVPATGVVNPPPPPQTGAPRTVAPAARSRSQTRVPQTSQDGALPPPSRPPADLPPPALDRSRELNALRDDYDKLSIRGEVVDDTLNRLWEEMRPLSPRVDMATRQQSLKSYLTRSQEALTEREAAEARRYLDMARADLEALERFLGRR